jgi:hypothetical protein
MAHQIEFQTSYRFKTTQTGITIPVTLLAHNHVVECEAKVDTGAEYCLFRREYAEQLQLDLASGQPVVLSTLLGTFDAFGHEVTLMTLDLAFEVTVYFAASEGIRRNLLGRNGWLNLVLLGLNAYDETLYLSPYDDLTT